MEDKFIWHYDKLGMYSIKPGYKWFQNLRLCISSASENMLEILWTKTWKLNVPLKIRHFIWRVLKNILPSRLNLLNKGIDIIPSCPVCGRFQETVDRALSSCERAKLVLKIVLDEDQAITDFNTSFIERWHNLMSICKTNKIELLATSYWAI